jgi:hypothetical protein
MRALLCLAAILCWIGCGTSRRAPAADGAAGQGQGSAGQDGASDSSGGGGGAVDGPADRPDAPATRCPADEPGFGATCEGTLSCQYGHSSCCGFQTSYQTCVCRNGFFDCYQTVECNVVCPDAGPG